MNINQPRKVPGKTCFYLLSSLYTEQILRAGHTAADQHDCIDYCVTGGPRVAGNRSPTGVPRDTPSWEIYASHSHT